MTIKEKNVSIDEIRANSSMGDPNAWNCVLICDKCLNRVPKIGCDACYCEGMNDFEMSDFMHDAQTTNECEMFIQK